MTQLLPPQQARQLVLNSQRLPPKPNITTLSAIEQLNYIQIDTISVVQRAHHHVLWSRNPHYTPAELDQLVEQKDVFEYWSHAAAYLPMRDFRYSLIRKQALLDGRLKHWHKPDPILLKQVLARIRAEGPLQSKDFEYKGEKTADWVSKPAKQALETLFMQGSLMIAKRINFHKVYDLTERVLPSHIDTSLPSDEEYARHLITRFLAAQGLGQLSEMAYLLKNTKPLLKQTLQSMLEAGEVEQVTVGDNHYYTLPEHLALLDQLEVTKQSEEAFNRALILSPFDNLVIQRQRLRDLFDFDYQIECYVPAAKRRFGYFSLPILWQGKLVARMDCKAERKTKVLQVHHLALEDSLVNASCLDDFKAAFQSALEAFKQFNGCEQVVMGRISPKGIKF